MSAVERLPARVEAASTAVTPAALVALAVEKGANVDQLERLMALQERWEATEARKAYVTAFSAFKAEAVTILKNRGVTDGPLKGKRYAELFSVVNAVTPALSKHGLSAAWKVTKDEKDWIEVTCTITHVLGHSEAVSMAGPPDTGGAKNAIQARASTITYLERYTLKAACGLAEQGDDTDGNTTGNRMDEKPLADFLAAIDAADSIEALQAIFGKAWKAAEAASDNGAKRLLTQHKDARKRALGGKS